MTDDDTTAVGLLRGLAGRVRDDTLNRLRALLAAGELDMMEADLLAELTRDRVPLLSHELPLLRDVRDYPESPLPSGLIVADPGTAPPAFEFAAAEPEPGDQRAVAGVFGIDDVKTIRKALRLPGTLVWVVELVGGADVSRWRRYLPDLSEFPASTCEIVADGERLPPYQAAALAAGLVVWRAD
ncbi:MAG TPA: hypothetical protein VM677_35015 [Actinokineospora sp.]|nr:hypothetical protein [Actinokineospora sp.]